MSYIEKISGYKKRAFDIIITVGICILFCMKPVVNYVKEKDFSWLKCSDYLQKEVYDRRL